MKTYSLSILLCLIIFVCSGQQIEKAEFFVDTDPGIGQAILVTIENPGNDITLIVDIDGVTNLQQGIHKLFVRTCDALGRWSHTYMSAFYVLNPAIIEAPNIIGVEYYLDDDPGYGMGKPISINAPGHDVTANFNVSLAGIENGDHFLYVRAKDASGHWSQTLIHAFSLNTTGLNDKDLVPLITIYPNPSKGLVKLEFTENRVAAFAINISNMAGQIVYAQKVEKEVTKMELNLESGVYLVYIETGTTKFIKKLIVE